MNVGEPTQVVTPTLDGPVLTVLARARESMTPGEVHRRCRRGSEPGVRRTLARLVGEEIVHARPAGNAVFYSLNRDHLAAALIAQLADLRPLLFARLREHFAEWEIPAVHVSLFGSTARGDGDEASDVDLLVVRPDDTDPDLAVWEAQGDRLRSGVLAWTGNRAQVVELDSAELRQASKRRERLIDEIRREGIHLFGVPLDSLIPARPILRRARR